MGCPHPHVTTRCSPFPFEHKPRRQRSFQATARAKEIEPKTRRSHNQHYLMHAISGSAKHPKVAPANSKKSFSMILYVGKCVPKVASVALQRVLKAPALGDHPTNGGPRDLSQALQNRRLSQAIIEVSLGIAGETLAGAGLALAAWPDLLSWCGLPWALLCRLGHAWNGLRRPKATCAGLSLAGLASRDA